MTDSVGKTLIISVVPRQHMVQTEIKKQLKLSLEAGLCFAGGSWAPGHLGGLQ